MSTAFPTTISVTAELHFLSPTHDPPFLEEEEGPPRPGVMDTSRVNHFHHHDTAARKPFLNPKSILGTTCGSCSDTLGPYWRLPQHWSGTAPWATGNRVDGSGVLNWFLGFTDRRPGRVGGQAAFIPLGDGVISTAAACRGETTSHDEHLQLAYKLVCFWASDFKFFWRRGGGPGPRPRVYIFWGGGQERKAGLAE